MVTIVPVQGRAASSLTVHAGMFFSPYFSYLRIMDKTAIAVYSSQFFADDANTLTRDKVSVHLKTVSIIEVPPDAVSVRGSGVGVRYNLLSHCVLRERAREVHHYIGQEVLRRASATEWPDNKD